MGNEAHLDHCHSLQNYKLKLLLLVILTNILTIFIFIGPFTPNGSNSSTKPQLAFAPSSALVAELHQRLNSTNLLVQALLIELTRQQDKQYCGNNNSPTAVKGESENNHKVFGLGSESEELKLAVGPHKLPLGFSKSQSQRLGISDEMQMAVGAACLSLSLRLQEELNQFMAYEIGGECPLDDVFAETLMLQGCHPLPRRRCRPKSLTHYEDPKPLPDSLWTNPPDTSTNWDPYTCKSYKCFIDLQSNDDNTRWVSDDRGLEFRIDQVLATKPKGTIRIGLDITNGSGTGTFAARMMEKNVTIVTSALNIEGPYNSLIASRGLVPIHISISQRLPFFENTLDIVHSNVNGIGNWMRESTLEFMVYDIYRVLRPGGLFWLDHFFCFRSQVKKTYSLLLGQVGFKRLRWHAGLNLGGRRNNEWYISALLEKPKF